MIFFGTYYTVSLYKRTQYTDICNCVK